MKDAKLHKHESITPDQSDREQSKENTIQAARAILFLIFIVCMVLFLSQVIEKQRFLLELLFSFSAQVISITLPLLVSILGSLIARFFLNLLYREQNNHVKLVRMDTSSYLAELKRKAKPHSLVTLSQWGLTKVSQGLTRSTTTERYGKPKKIRLRGF